MIACGVTRLEGTVVINDDGCLYNFAAPRFKAHSVQIAIRMNQYPCGYFGRANRCGWTPTLNPQSST
jgi:hypothetical protein